jgi:hypothetical protein
VYIIDFKERSVSDAFVTEQAMVEFNKICPASTVIEPATVVTALIVVDPLPVLMVYDVGAILAPIIPDCV